MVAWLRACVRARVCLPPLLLAGCSRCGRRGENAMLTPPVCGSESWPRVRTASGFLLEAVGRGREGRGEERRESGAEVSQNNMRPSSCGFTLGALPQLHTTGTPIFLLFSSSLLSLLLLFLSLIKYVNTDLVGAEGWLRRTSRKGCKY